MACSSSYVKSLLLIPVYFLPFLYLAFVSCFFYLAFVLYGCPSLPALQFEPFTHFSLQIYYKYLTYTNILTKKMKFSSIAPNFRIYDFVVSLSSRCLEASISRSLDVSSSRRLDISMSRGLEVSPSRHFVIPS